MSACEMWDGEEVWTESMLLSNWESDDVSSQPSSTDESLGSHSDILLSNVHTRLFVTKTNSNTVNRWTDTFPQLLASQMLIIYQFIYLLLQPMVAQANIHRQKYNTKTRITEIGLQRKIYKWPSDSRLNTVNIQMQRVYTIIQYKARALIS